MASPSISYAGQFDLEICRIQTAEDNILDLKPSVVEINIYEDINRASITGEIFFMDQHSLVENAPLIGQETLFLKLNTPNHEEPIDFSQNPVQVYKLGTKMDTSRNVELIGLHFVSMEVMKNERKKVSQSYHSETSKMVEDILRDEDYLDTKKQLFIERSLGVRKIIFPRVHPFSAIHSLKKDSISERTNSPHYYFFENARGIHFRTLQSLYREPPVREFHYGELGDRRSFNLAEQRAFENVAEQYRRVLYWRVISTSDMLISLGTGLLSSSYLEHDIFNKTYTEKKFNYFDDFDKFARTAGGGDVGDVYAEAEKMAASNRGNPIYNGSRVDGENTLGEFSDARYFVHPTSVTTDGRDAQHYNTTEESYSFNPNQKSRTLASRESKVMELESTFSATIQAVGHTGLCAGDMINFLIPKSDGEIDESLSGRYLIKDMRHHFSVTSARHTMHMTVIRDASLTSLSDLEINEISGEKQGTQFV